MPALQKNIPLLVIAAALCAASVLHGQQAQPADTSAPGTASDTTAAATDSSIAAVAVEVSTATDSTPADTSAIAASADSTAAEPAAQAAAVQQARPRPTYSGTRLDAQVIPWDWDDYTNVIEVGLRRLSDGREYSLSPNEQYTELLQRYKDRKVTVWGNITRDTDGFYNMEINGFEPLDTTGAAQAAARP